MVWEGSKFSTKSLFCSWSTTWETIVCNKHRCHFMWNIWAFICFYLQVKICEWNVTSPTNYFIANHLSEVFNVLPYNTFFGVWGEWMDISNNLLWSFVDLLLMNVGFSLAFRFRQINERLKLYYGIVGKFWILNLMQIKPLSYFRCCQKVFGLKFEWISFSFVSWWSMLTHIWARWSGSSFTSCCF